MVSREAPADAVRRLASRRAMTGLQVGRADILEHVAGRECPAARPAGRDDRGEDRGRARGRDNLAVCRPPRTSRFADVAVALQPSAKRGATRQ